MDHSSTPETCGVVVGVDGSEGAKAALHWAVAEARLRKTRLIAVHAWTFGYAGVPGGGFGYLGGPLQSTGSSAGDMHQWAEELLERETAEISAQATDVEIERLVVEAGAAQALVDAAGEHDLLVVGSRGHGGFAGVLLGSARSASSPPTTPAAPWSSCTLRGSQRTNLSPPSPPSSPEA